jgi:recombinational DNA repair ATPase RecF
MPRIIDSELQALNTRYNAAHLAYENATRARAEMAVTGTDAWERLFQAEWAALRALAEARAEFLAALTQLANRKSYSE